jgi:lipid II:glycine glycyltransferase (peptidoglycan interpeptide bridge formation enzyme)
MTAAMAPAVPATDRWQAWDRFLGTTDGTGFMQSSWWADFRTTTGYRNFGTVLKDQNTIVGGALVLRYSPTPDTCFYYVPEGPVLPEDEAVAAAVFEGMLEAIDEERKNDPLTVSHLRIEPRWLSVPGFIRGFEAVPEFRDGYMEPRNTLCVDLRLPEDAILCQMRPKGRYNIRVAQRHGVSIVEDSSAGGLADFLGIYREMTRRQGIGRKPESYFRNLLSSLSFLRQGSLFFAEHEGMRVAAALVVYFGRRATYFFGASLDTHRHVMAPYLLHFEIMRRARAMGHDWYDFWGIAPESQPNHPWQNITAFKRKFGGVELNLVPTMDHVYDRSAYHAYMAWASR